MLAPLVLALALGGQPPSPARLVTGTVLDPEGLPVAGAEVRVICSAASSSANTSTTTDGRGRFGVELGGDVEDCRVRVTAGGFSPLEHDVGGVHPARLALRLRLRPHEEHLTVHADAAAHRFPRGVVVEGALLRELIPDADTMVDYARALAGAAGDRAQIVVDGVPRTALPDAARIDRVLVNVDPYSAASAGLDGARIDVETAAVRPSWTYGANLSPGSIAGRHPLGAGHQWHTRNASAHATGPLPWQAWAWSGGARHTRREQEQPLLAHLPWEPQPSARAVSRGERTTSAFAAAGYLANATRATIDLSLADTSFTAAGSGGLVLPEASVDGAARTFEAHAVFRRQSRAFAVKSSGTLSVVTRTSAARSAEQSAAVHGAAVGGGAPLLADRTHAIESWWTTGVEGSAWGRTWRAGLDVGLGRAEESWLPNALGILHLAPDGDQATPTLLEIDRGAGRADARRDGAGMYGELQWLRTPAATLTSGFRIDISSRDAPAFQPRFSGNARLAGGTLTVGAGRFVEDWTAETLLPLRARAAETVEHLAFDGVCAGTLDLESCRTLRGLVNVSISRQRQAVASIGFGRPVGKLELAGDYRWSAASHVPSLARELTPGGWQEQFASEGRQRGHELRVRAGIGSRSPSLVAHYAWRRVRETTDGWYGAPVSGPGLSEWVPAAGIPAHEGGFVLSIRTRGGTSASIVGALSAGSPVDLVFSPRTVTEALTGPRRPGTRNAGAGPSSATVSFHASRTARVPLTRVRGRIGAQVLNLAGRRNLLRPVAVVDSPLYGRPTDAGVGRTLSVWFSLGG